VKIIPEPGSGWLAIFGFFFVLATSEIYSETTFSQ